MPSIERKASESTPRKRRISSTLRSWAMSWSRVAKSTPKWQGWRMGGQEIRRWISLAPASRICFIFSRVVVPRTIESSTTTTRLPATISATTLSFRRTAARRSCWVGLMKVRPT